ncbi:lamin tail domain-containing protein [Candidatus Peregrinibacteria bacterium]|nr:MAG: lamin tail domain-containing protein [Candidatus Peregrinibacteria bacterium]
MIRFFLIFFLVCALFAIFANIASPAQRFISQWIRNTPEDKIFRSAYFSPYFAFKKFVCKTLSLFLVFLLSASTALADVIAPLPQEDLLQLFVDPNPSQESSEETVSPPEEEGSGLFAPLPNEESQTLFINPEEDIPEEVPTSTPEENTTPLAKFGEIFISEVVTNPKTGEEEWVELALMIDETRDISGLLLFDEVGKIFTIPQNTLLTPGEFLVFSGWGSKLNNTGDSVFLKNANDEILASAENIPALNKGQSWLPEESIIGVPTAGAENEWAPNPPPEEVLPQDSPEEEVPASDPPQNETPPNVFPPITSDDILINEVLTNPEIGEEEWVEIISLANEEKSLAGCALFDAVGKIYSFPNEASIAPNTFLVVSGWGSKLNNTGDSVFLKNANDEILASAENIPALNKGQSWLPEESVIGVPTAGAENEWVSDPSPLETEIVSEENLPADIVINEIMSHPKMGEEEWVELFSNAETSFDLGGFFLADATGAFYEIPEGTLLLPETYLVLSGWSGKLNNSGDEISLLSPTKTEVVAPTVFPSLKIEESWAFSEDGYRKTNIPTPGQKNRFPIISYEEKTATTPRKTPIPPLAKTPATRSSVRAEDIVLRISEALFHGTEEDFVELFCEKCDTDLSGIRVGDDDTFFEFPEGSILPSGAFVVLHLAKEKQEARQEENIWHFWTKKSGLTGTDETLFILDSLGTVEDGLCIANRNGSFSPGEEDDVVRLIREQAFSGIHPLSEDVCFDSRILGKDRSLVAIPKKVGTAAQNAFDASPTPGKPNPAPPLRAEGVSLSLSDGILLPDNSLSFRIQNTGKRMISLRGFSLQTGESVSPLPESDLFPNESSFSFLTVSGTDRIFLKDAWEAVSAKFLLSEARNADIGANRLVISEVLVNPDGVDVGNEFLEIQCLTEECPAEEFAIFVGENRIPFSKKLRRGEYFVFSDIALRNSNLLVQVFDLSLGKKDEFSLENSHSGESMVRSESGFLATLLPTPKTENRIFTKEMRGDSDGDGIPDTSEILLGSNPSEKNSISSVEYRLFQSFVRAGTQVEAKETPDGILFAGKALPETDIHIVLHSDIRIVSAKTDAEGNFSVLSSPDIPSGVHRADVVMTSKNGLPLIIKDVTQVYLSKNPREGWLSGVQIAQVLPNPEGKDAGQESIILRNTENHSGILAGAVLRSGNREIHLPKMDFLSGQARVLHGDLVPPLRNTDGSIFLVDADGNTISTVSWKTAKNGKWIGPEAPILPLKAKKVKAKKSAHASSKKASKNSGSEEASSFPVRQEIHGTFGGIRGNMLVMLGDTGEESEYPISNRVSPRLLNLLLSEGEKISVVVENGKVFSVDALPELSFFPVPPSFHAWGISFFLFLAFFSGCLFFLLPIGIRFGKYFGFPKAS